MTATVAVMAVLGGASWWLRRRSRRVPLMPLPPEPRPHCPWCDTHECIDRTMCNCGAPCGSWLCMAREASRG